MAGKLQFQPVASAVDIGFWFALSQKKLEEFKLDNSLRKIHGFYSVSIDPSIPPLLHITRDSFFPDAKLSPLQVKVPGTLLVCNTLEEFKGVNRTDLMKEAEVRIWGEDAKNHFLMITFPDLKNYLFYYWFAFPVLNFDPVSYEIRNVNEVVDESRLKVALSNSLQSEEWSRYHGFVGVNVSDVSFFPLDEGTFASHVLFLDPAARSDVPSSIPRNYLVQLARKARSSEVNLIALKDGFSSDPDFTSFTHSRVFKIWLPALHPEPEFLGWELNNRGKLGPKMADLRPHMDPTALANSAVDLNLKLMRWRLVPNLDLELIASRKCLLLGAGTLGCNIARCLLAWGVKNITFVDYGKVAYSNPVRQSLYTFEDSKAQIPKAVAAAESLKRIVPTVQATGFQFQILMPGHSISGREEAAQKDLAQLENLIETHDVVFLLTDSRESRWLPTVLTNVHHKICITAALGFETFLVMRHGASVLEAQEERLGCYFCNDVVAPRNSMIDRTLDQQCTVTRPGVAYLGSSLAVELLMSLLHHLKREASAVTSPPECLGTLPHQIRGVLSSFEQNLYQGRAFSKCTACSETVVTRYMSQGFGFVKEVCEDPEFLERLLGLNLLEEEAADAIIELD